MFESIFIGFLSAIPASVFFTFLFHSIRLDSYRESLDSRNKQMWNLREEIDDLEALLREVSRNFDHDDITTILLAKDARRIIEDYGSTYDRY